MVQETRAQDHVVGLGGQLHPGNKSLDQPNLLCECVVLGENDRRATQHRRRAIDRVEPVLGQGAREAKRDIAGTARSMGVEVV